MKMYLALALVGAIGSLTGGCSQAHSDVVPLDRVKTIGINDASEMLEIEGIFVYTESSAKVKLYQLAVICTPDSLDASAEAYPKITKVLTDRKFDFAETPPGWRAALPGGGGFSPLG